MLARRRSLHAGLLTSLIFFPVLPTMIESNAVQSRINDLTERLESLRGYL